MKDTCDQCGTSWEVPESVCWEEEQWNPKGNLPLKQMRILEDQHGASGYDAKSVALHIPWSGGNCHNCAKRIPRGWIDCKHCGATNYNFHGPPTLAQRLGITANPLLKIKSAEQDAPDDI